MEPRVEKTLENLLNEMPTVQGSSKFLPKNAWMLNLSGKRTETGTPAPCFHI